jgi:diguanylate cyclase (GGDEF)-like protein/PAS domain S-box-containing protein
MNKVAGSGSPPPDYAKTIASGRRQALRETLAIATATLAAAGAGVAGLWITSSATIRDNYSHYLKGVAISAAQLVDPELHATFRDPAQLNGEDYRRAVAPLRRMRAAVPDVRYIYTIVREGKDVRFVLDAADPGDHDGDGVNDQAGLWEVYRDGDPAMLEALGSDGEPGRATATDRPYADKWGSFMTGWAPLKDQAGRQIGAVGVDVNADVYVARLETARRWALLGLLPAGFLIAVLCAAFYRIRVRYLEAADGAARTALELAAEQERLSSVIEGTLVGTWEVHLGARDDGEDDMFVDARWAAMLGRSADELNPLTRGVIQTTLVHPDDVPKMIDAVMASMQQEDRLLEMDLRMRHAAGHWVWVEVRGKVIERDAKGRPLRMVGTQLDVSARKAVEVALGQSESSFRSLFELSPVGICLADMHTGRFLQVNDALLDSTGYTREELLQRTYTDITPSHWREFERRQLAVLEHSTHFPTYEKEYQRKDGSRYPVLVSGTRMRDLAGRDVIWAIVQDISQRKAMESELAEAARRDKLTGLANRTLFIEWLQAAVDRVKRGQQERFAVLFLDFDRFKLVNDAMGHEAGDELLREIAARLRGLLSEPVGHERGPASNLIARFGGDEFLVLLNDLENCAAAEQTAERLLGSLSKSYSVNGRDVYSTASIGIVTSEQCMESAEAVVRNADVAMYEAKRSGRACAVVFNEAMRTRLTRHVTIESNLRKALGTREISLVYQPIVELETGRMTSVEALARWQHPMLGQVSPTEFIPVAEESGLIAPLGQWVLQEACRALAAWRRESPERAPQSISINISRAELALGDRLLARVQSALEETGLPAGCLQLEVTEREVMRDPHATLRLMHALRDMGVRLAMDDFGTGTSSLGCLRDYPFDVIKIDRSFVHDISGNADVLAVIHATITLVENLGKMSVAEGVEKREQVAVLQSLGCHYAQGYFFSTPLSEQQMLGFMAEKTAVRIA